MSEIDRNRQLRRRHMHERQAVVFGVLLAALALAGLGAAAVYTGKLDLPGLDRAIAVAPSPTEVAQPYPCPPTGALPVPYGKVTVNVNNATTRVGLAGATATELQARGFAIGTKSNVDSYDGVARISFGKNGVAEAYTLLAQFDGATMLALAGDDKAVSVALGAKFESLKPADKVGLDPAKPLVAPKGCMPYEKFASTAQTPAPTPAG